MNIMSINNKNLHLTLQERQIIQTGIENGSTKVAIAATVDKDKSTIGKEIKAHRQLIHRCSYATDCTRFKNVLTIISVINVMTMFLSNVPTETDPLVPVMDVQNSNTAAMTNSNIAPIFLKKNMNMNWSTPESVLI